MRWVIVLLLGLGLGLLAALGDAATGVTTPTTLGSVLTIATHLGSMYAAAAVLAGAFLARRRNGLLAGPLLLIAAVVGYTGYVALFVDHERLGVSSLAGVFSIYLLAAVTIGPFLSMLGQVARDRGLVGTLARLAVPLALVAEVVVRFPLSRSTYQVDPTRAWTLTAIIAVGALATLAGTLGHRTARHS
ncbi:hypothetical protein D9V37_17665 [Nocardioides mangrovicus]|uniref:Uncharacterized protein n=1 Tax=Nocardioides mangrovicus TaxID=2478913 RepID=A0A3L8NXH7_9ACTN|nr:hypothetical protein [Nocardioides mangrovicus]RLV47936.1 hypothetical protein D9V37_17665 [Nocardioides mangrovicus]